MATDQYLMAEGTCLKVAPLTENGNNCPTSEQAPKRTPKELWPPFQGSERVRERYAAKFADVPARHHQRAGTRRNPARENSVHTFSTSCAKVAIEEYP